MIMFWGPSSAGKTALLSYLYLRADSVESDWNILPTEQSMPQILKQSKQILEQNLFPLGNAKSETPGLDLEREISYDFYNKKTKTGFALQTKDLAGIRSEELSSGNNADTEILDSLVQAEGIVLFLDHGRINATTEVSRALDQMYVRRAAKSYALDDRPLAVCLSKVDELIKHPMEYKALQDDPERFVQDRLGEELVRTIRKYHGRVRFFPVSSVGIHLSFGSLQKSVFYDERLKLRVTKRGTPINIVEPFIWIFEQLQKAS